METLDLIPGSQAWLDARSNFFVASEAPAIMGESPYVSRSDLLYMKTTGDEKAINKWTQLVFDQGHNAEELARPIAEERLGEALFPIAGTDTIEGLPLLATFDGLTMLEDNHWEHKQYNKALYELVKSGGDLEPQHYWQLEHQLLVRDAKSCIFAVSDGTEENYAELVYRSRPARRKQLIQGWKVFAEDLANYHHEEVPVASSGEAVMELPALRVEISGEVKTSNLPAYQAKALAFIQHINTDLQTDNDFATAENTIKALGKLEKELDLVKRQTLGQVVSIDELVRTIDVLHEQGRGKRLELERLVKERKKAIRAEIAATAKEKWVDHLRNLARNLPVPMPYVAVDFAEALKGKRTVATLREAANNELARAKAEANAIAEHIGDNYVYLTKLAGEKMFLFSDLAAVCLKEREDLESLAKLRIAEHAAMEEQRIEAKAKTLIAEKSHPPQPRNVIPDTVPDTVMMDGRPSDQEIVEALCQVFDATESDVYGWLCDMQLN